ncbi:MAG: YbaK/EbsC family protein [bacterium]|nr:YbaK/EbsC family protein [Gammaproteobacteria bacterium]HIL97012.1 YbaK/EbsC family protein [Pseudomonadales bacterium]
MTIASKVDNYLKDHGIDYQVLTHRYSEGTYNTSVAAHVSMRKLAKAVLLVDQHNNHLLAVLPASHLLNINKLNQQLNQTYRFVEEIQLADFFTDCSQGAVPAVGQAYDLPVICEDILYEESEVFLEGGDHEALIQLDKAEFCTLMENQPHMTFSVGRNVSIRESGLRH